MLICGNYLKVLNKYNAFSKHQKIIYNLIKTRGINVKKIIFLFILSLSANAQVGFKCPNLQMEILKSDSTIKIKNQTGTREITNNRLVLPIDQSTDSYQERYGIYYALMTEAHLHFPYMPEWLMFYHLSKSTNLFKKGFKAFEGEGSSVELNKMYCKAFIQAIEKY